MFLNEGFAAVAALAATTLATPASTGQISKTINLRAHVPVYCNVGWFPQIGAVSTGGTVDLGVTEELCNAPRGYRVILQHPTDVRSEEHTSELQSLMRHSYAVFC